MTAAAFVMHRCSLKDHFDNLNNWTAIGPLGIANWELSTFGFAGGTPPELRINWTPEFNGLSRLISIPIINNSPQEFLLSFNHFCDWFSDPAPILGVAVTYDQGCLQVKQYGRFNPLVATLA